MAIKYSSIGGGSGTGFNVQVGSPYSYATFTQAQPAGAYTIKSSNNYTNWDVYLLDASNNLVAYTGSASIAPTTAFSAIVVVNGTLNDILQFSFASTVFSTATTSQTKAGPFITAFGSSVIPSVNSAVTITGGNFAVGILATFTGIDNVVRACKSVVYTSTSSISVVRPDVLPVGFAPYVLTLTNPGVDNPATSGKHRLTGLTVGNAPVWSTATSLAAADPGTAYSATVVATDVEGAVTYSYVSGTLPTGLSFNASTGVISGSYSGSTSGTASYTIRATDNGGNFTDRTFTISYTSVAGGTLITSDATYYYRLFNSNNTLTTSSSFTFDVLMVAGGGGGGYDVGSGGGAGGVVLKTAQTVGAGSYPIVVGAGGAARPNSSSADPASNYTGINTTFNSLIAYGGGGAGSWNGVAAASGGSGGGGAVGYQGGFSLSGGSAIQPGSATGGFGSAGGTGTGANGANEYAGAAGGGGAGGVGGNGQGSAWGAGSTTVANGGVGVSITQFALSGMGDPDFVGWYGGGGGASTDGGTSWSYGGKGGGGDGNNRSVSNGTGTSGYYYISGKPYTGGGGGGGGSLAGTASSSSSGNGGGAGGSGVVIIRYTRASVGG